MTRLRLGMHRADTAAGGGRIEVVWSVGFGAWMHVAWWVPRRLA